jgi:hypothetical protein
MWLDNLKRRAKRILNQNYHSDKFYSHAILTINIQLSVAFEHEITRFARLWCIDEDIVAEVRAIKEIFETENEDDMVWYAERLSNKYADENIDRLVSGVYARLRT